MRISDWSSDVCSSDLKGRSGLAAIHDAMPTNAVRADSVQNASPFSGGTKSIVAIFCNSTRTRSEEHTSELQSLMRISYAVFCLKKNTSLHSPYIYPTYTIIRTCT